MSEADEQKKAAAADIAATHGFREIRRNAKEDKWSSARTQRAILSKIDENLPTHPYIARALLRRYTQFIEDTSNFGYDTAVTISLELPHTATYVERASLASALSKLRKPKRRGGRGKGSGPSAGNAGGSKKSSGGN